VVGTQPLFGGFSAADFLDRTSYRPVILMYDTWQGRFGGDPDVVGRVEILIRPRDFGFRIVGVMPRGFTFPSPRVAVDFIAPMVPTTPAATTDPRIRSVSEVVARLPRGMTPNQLVERLAPGLAASAAQYASFGGARQGYDPKTERPYDTVSITPLSKALARRSGGLFLGVVVAALVLLVLTAANVSSLMTSRALERRRELDVRRALGATRGALIRLWTTEAAVLLAAGTVAGVLAAAPALTLVVSLLPESVVLLKAPRIDWRVAGFAAMTMALLCAAISIAPIRSSLRPPAGGAAKGGSSERLRTPGRFVVIAGQVAAAFVLTTVGACLVGSLLVVYGQDLPIRTDGVIVLESRLHGPGGGRGETAERVARGRLILERLAAIPGVTSVGLVEAEVLRGGGSDLFSRPEGVARLPGIDAWGVTGAFYVVVQPVLAAGRLPTEQELDAGDPLIVVSERVARAYWPGEAAVGQTLTHLRSQMPHMVIGVVRDVRWHGWDLESPMIYGPYPRLTSSPFQTFFIRTEVEAAATIAQAVSAVVETDPTMRPRTAATLEEMYRASVALRRFQSWLFGGFAAAALVVVGVGILGLLAMSAARRTREVGIRCALGATPGSVTRLMVREQLVAVGTGLVVGGAVAAWAVGLVEGYLYQLSVNDPRIWGAAVAMILITAGAGTLAPALRASRIDPLRALRTE
jgi:predicted permease